MFKRQYFIFRAGIARAQFRCASAVEEARRLNQTFELRSASNLVRQPLPCYTTLARQRFKRRASSALYKIHNLY